MKIKILHVSQGGGFVVFGTKFKIFLYTNLDSFVTEMVCFLRQFLVLVGTLFETFGTDFEALIFFAFLALF